MLLPLAEATARRCGAKAGTLGTLVRAAMPVPDGLVVPLATCPPRPEALVEELRPALAALGDPPVAVRSSATGEDGPTASAAGQYESVLAVRGAESVAGVVAACWASLDTARATAYRAGRLPGTDRPAMAVLIQRLVDAEVSGVMFTAADTAAPTVVEASWGLGTGVVGGTVTPDRYLVSTDGSVACAVADKRTRTDRAGATLVTREVTGELREARALDDETAVELARLGEAVAAVLGGPQDVEWALAGGELHLVQSRPVTADPLATPRTADALLVPPPAAAVPGPGARTVLTGTPGSHGLATGVARPVTGPADFHTVRPGDVLLCPWTDPAWTPLLRMAGAVVTQTGGLLSHAAIVAREYRIPAVLGVADATTAIEPGTVVTVDGSAGTVTLPGGEG